MRLSLRQLQIFIAVGQTGSATAAGRSIALSQSAVSTSLAELEDLLGTKLFDRAGKRLKLNENGQLLMPQALALLDEASVLEKQFLTSTKLAALSLKVGASTTIGNYLMPKLITDFRKSIPIAHGQVHIGNTSEITAKVANFKVDIGFIEGPCHEPDLEVTPWLSDELVIVSTPNHPLAKRQRSKKITLKDLRKAKWLLREPGSGTREAVEQALLPHLHHLNTEMVFGNAEAIKHAVAQNLGLSCLSRLVVAEMLLSKQLVVLHTPLPKLSRRFYLIRHKKRPLSEGLGRFIQHCQSAIGSRPLSDASVQQKQSSLQQS